MITSIVVIHILVSVVLIALVLVQTGRGTGIAAVFGAGGMSQSLFGIRTGTFLTRLTTVLAIIFMLTSLSLAMLSSRSGKSLVERVKEKQVEEGEEAAAPAEGAEEEATPAEGVEVPPPWASD